MPSRSQQQLERALGNLISAKDEDEELSEEEFEQEEVAVEEQFVEADLEEELDSTNPLRNLPVDSIEFSSYQTRSDIDQTALDELSESISSKGLIQPIVVRPVEAALGKYEVVAGERRLRAARLAGLDSIPAIVGSYDDQETLELAIIENAQREDINPVDEAKAFQRLSEEFSMNQKDIAAVTGKNRSTISNSLRLLNLEEEIIEYLQQGELSAGHARALLAVEDESDRVRFARKTIKSALSVRALEVAISRYNEDEEEPDEEFEELKQKAIRQGDKVADILGLDVNMNLDKQGRKKLQITFPSEAAWKRFVSRIKD